MDGYRKVETYRTRPNIPHLPTLHHVIQRPHDLLARRLAIQPVDLQHVDVGAQPLDASVHRVEDVLPRQSDAVDEAGVVASGRRDGRLTALIVHAEEALGQDDHAVTRDVVLLQRLADDLLGAAVGVDVGLGALAFL